MKEVVSLPEENEGYIKVLEYYLAALLVAMGFFTDSDMVSILAGAIFSLFYIFSYPYQSVWVCAKAIIFGLSVFWTIQLILGLNYFNENGQWPPLQTDILKSAVPMLGILSLFFSLIKWLFKKPPTNS